MNLRIGSENTKIIIRLNCLGEIGDLLGDVAGGPRDVLLITDVNVAGLFEAAARESLERTMRSVAIHRIAPGEASKSLESLVAMYDWFAERRASRDSLVLALGGGVVSDLAGLAAATWMRGLDYAICPTTLEAMIDAAIGGKTAINRPTGKNLVGAFHQPLLVGIDPACLKTLDARDVRAGLAESVKHALIADGSFFEWHERRMDSILALDEGAVTELVSRNVAIKRDIVERDPFERSGDRMVLNFGHTIGHAIEQRCDYALRHGECVALGMIGACRVSEALSMIPAEVVERVQSVVERAGLPTRLTAAVDVDQLMDTMMGDKKVRGGAKRFVLLESIGRAVIRDDVPESTIRAACASIAP